MPDSPMSPMPLTGDDAVDALAAYRITRLIVDDAILDTPRERVRAALERGGHGKLIELLECYWCTGMWVAFGVVAARRLAPRPWSFVARALAASTVVGTIDRLLA